MPEFAVVVLEFMKTHQMWAAPIVFLLAFGESLAIFALILPASIILWGVGNENADTDARLAFMAALAHAAKRATAEAAA